MRIDFSRADDGAHSEDIMKSTFSKAALVTMIAVPLALTACSSPDSSSGNNSPGSSASATQSSSANNADKGTGMPENPKSELLVQMNERFAAEPKFAGLSAECKATVVRMGIGFTAPLASSIESLKPGTVQQVKDAVAELKGATPASLNGAFETIEATAGTDEATKAENTDKITAMFKPISDWLTANCNGFVPKG